MEKLFFLGLALDHARRLAIAQKNERPVDQIEHFLRLLGVFAAALGRFLEVIDTLLQTIEIGQHQLGLDDVDVGDRIDLAFDMSNVGILEAAHDVHNRIDFADGGEELVAEPLALRGTAHQSGDVDERNAGRDDLLRLPEYSQLVEARIGYGDFADIW